MKKKGLFFFITLVALSLYGMAVISHQKELNKSNFARSQKEWLANLQQEAQQDQAVIIPLEHPQHYLKVPFNQAKSANPSIKQDMLQVSKTVLPKKANKNDYYLLTVKPEKEHHQALTYQYVLYHYQWNNRAKKWQTSTKPLKNRLTMNKKNEKKLTLGDLFSSQKNLLSITRQLQEKALNKQDKPINNIDDLLNQPALDSQQTTFVLRSDSVVVDYAKKKETLYFKDFGHFLNNDFVDKKYLTKETPPPVTDQQKKIALTFDDGPAEKTTLALLELLQKEAVPATFFMLGQQVEKFPNIVAEVAKAGHEIGNHSYSHQNLTNLPTEGIQAEINKTQKAIYQATGQLPRYTRPPYGAINYQTAVIIGMPIINWSVDSLDWKSQDHQKIQQEVKKTFTPNSILLFHDIYPETIAALPTIIKELKKQGFQFVTISDLYPTDPEPLITYYNGHNQQILMP